MNGRQVWLALPEATETRAHECARGGRDARARDPRLALIGLTQGPTPGDARRYAARHGLTFDQHDVGRGGRSSPVVAA